MDVTRLKMLLDLYDGNTLVDVAKKYSYTPSAISHMLKAIETDLGIRIFIRDRNGMITTPEGRELYSSVQSVTAAYDNLKAKAQKLSNSEETVIRLGAFTSIVVSWLPGIINSFKEKYPDARFEILQDSYTQVNEWVSTGYVDCAFTADSISDEVVSHLVSKDKYYVIFPEGHPLGTAESFTPMDLENYPMIVLNEGSEVPIMAYMEANKIQVNPICRVWDDYAVCAMVESGIGISIVPELFLYRTPYMIGSRVLDEDFYRSIYLSYRKSSDVSPILCEFIKHVKDWAEENKNLIQREREGRLILDGDKTDKI